jgi:uncharacterized protein (DUF433 family)
VEGNAKFDSFSQWPVLDLPAYSIADAASYARVPYQTVRYWARGRGDVGPLITLPQDDSPILSYLNLLECHVLNALRTNYELQINVVRRALETLDRLYPSTHPLLETVFSTDKIDLLVEKAGTTINLSKGGQVAMKEMLETYLHRIERTEFGIPKLYPFVARDRPDEPKIISILPTIAFGRSVIDGTGISTAVISARFKARESISALADEYGRSVQEIEEAIRWETNRTAAAA